MKRAAPPVVAGAKPPAAAVGAGTASAPKKPKTAAKPPVRKPPPSAAVVVPLPAPEEKEESKMQDEEEMQQQVEEESSSFVVPGFPLAIPIIMQEPDSDQFRWTAEATAFFQSDLIRKHKLRIVTVSGPYRTGKSALLNLLVRFKLPPAALAAASAVFGVDSSNRAKTKGIWLSTVVTPMPDNSLLMWMDTEGLGAIDATSTNDTRIFCLAELISSLLIYNCYGAIEKRKTEELEMSTALCRHIRLRASTTTTTTTTAGDESETKDEGVSFMPDFMWLCRDAHVTIMNRHGQPCSADEWLNEAFQPEAGGVDLRQIFEHRSCRRLVRPCNEEEQLRKLDSLAFSELRPEFQTQFRELYRDIYSSVKLKTVGALLLTGEALPQLMSGYLNAINSGAAPVIMNQVAMLTEIYCRQAYDEAMQKYKTEVDQWVQVQQETINGLIKPEVAKRQYEVVWKVKALKLYETQAFGTATDLYRTNLEKALDLDFSQRLVSFYAEIKKQLGDLTLALSQGGFATIGALREAYEQTLEQFNQVGTTPEMRLLWAECIQSKLLTWCQATASATEKELVAAKTTIGQLENQRSEQLRVNELLKQQQEETQKSTELEKQQLLQQHDQQRMEWDHALVEAKRVHAEFAAAADDLQSKWQTQLTEQRAQVEKQVEVLRAELASKTKSEFSAVARVAELESKTLQLQKTNNELEPQLLQLQSQVLEAQSCKARAEELTRQKQTCMQQLKEQQEQHDEQRSSWTKEMEGLMGQHAVRLAEARRQLDQLQQERDKQAKDTEQVLATQRAELVQALEQKHVVEQQVKEWKDKAQTAAADGERTRSSLEKQLAAARTEVKELHDKLLKQMNAHHERLTEVTTRELTKMQEWNTQSAQLQLQMERTMSEKVELRRQLDEQIPVIASAAMIKEQRDKLTLELKQCQQRNESTANQLQDQREECAILRERTSTLEKQCLDAQVKAQTAAMFSKLLEGTSHTSFSSGAPSFSSFSSSAGAAAASAGAAAASAGAPAGAAVPMSAFKTVFGMAVPKNTALL